MKEIVNMENYAEETIAVPKKYYVMITNTTVHVLDNMQDLFNELYCRTDLFCEVFAFETLEEANYFAYKRYGFLFYTQFNKDEDKQPIALPMAGTYSLGSQEYAINANSIQQMKQGYIMQKNATGIWAMDFMNGFGTEMDLSNFVYFMADNAVIYPHAVWIPDVLNALLYSCNKYVQRFFHRYGYNVGYITLPAGKLTFDKKFFDAQFEEREKILDIKDIEKQNMPVKLAMQGLMI